MAGPRRGPSSRPPYDPGMAGRSEEGEDLVPLPVGERSAVLSGSGPPDRPAPERPGLDRRWRALGLGALLAVLVGAGALSGVDGQQATDPPADPGPTGPGVPTAS